MSEPFPEPQYQPWQQQARSARQPSTYTRRSESPSIYSRRFGDSPQSSYVDFPDDRSRSPSPSNTIHRGGRDNALGDLSDGDERANRQSQTSEDTRLSVMGPTTRVYSRAPWEAGGDDNNNGVLQEAADEDEQTETRSLFGGRGRSKKPKEANNKESYGLAKGLGLVAGVGVGTPRASSSSRPSIDGQSIFNSSSSQYSAGPRPSFSSNIRPPSTATTNSGISDWFQLPSPTARGQGQSGSSGSQVGHGHGHGHGYGQGGRDKSPGPSPRSGISFDAVASPIDSQPRLPYASSEIAYGSPLHQSHAPLPTPGTPNRSVHSSSPFGDNARPSMQGHNPYIQPTLQQLQQQQPGAPHDFISLPQGLPVKMTPWQQTPSSPTFQLLSLEEAQAMKAKQQRSGTEPAISGPGYVRNRTVSSPNVPKSHTMPPQESAEGDHQLKGRKSLLNLFAKKEKERSTTSPVPPVPALPPSIPGTPLGPSLFPSSGDGAPSQASRRVQPPSLNVNTPQGQHPGSFLNNPGQTASPVRTAPSTPLANIPMTGAIPRKQVSHNMFAGRQPVSKPPSINSNPGTSSSQQLSIGLSLRPMSSMLSSMPTDYLTPTTSSPPPTSVQTASFRGSSGNTDSGSPSTPAFSSRSTSVSTHSSEAPGTPVGGEASMSLTQLRDQVNGAKEAWQAQIAELEAQVKALKQEVADLKAAPCAHCGSIPMAIANDKKSSVLNRPRAKTAGGVGRTLFGGDE